MKKLLKKKNLKRLLKQVSFIRENIPASVIAFEGKGEASKNVAIGIMLGEEMTLQGLGISAQYIDNWQMTRWNNIWSKFMKEKNEQTS